VSDWSSGLSPNSFTVDHLLYSHGYGEGTEQERVLQVFKDLARAKAELAVHAMHLSPSQRALVDQSIHFLLDR